MRRRELYTAFATCPGRQIRAAYIFQIARRQVSPYPRRGKTSTRAQDDLVWLHMHVNSKPETRGNAIIHIFRMENGKFVEHWAVDRPVSEKSVHGNSMF
jgi:predicted SnoaL-like aldol condensation-catalyzing enzyme